MTFVETFSPFILYELQWDEADLAVRKMFERQWGHLREAVLFCLRHQAGQHTMSGQRAAKYHFQEYALAVQEVCLPRCM